MFDQETLDRLHGEVHLANPDERLATVEEVAAIEFEAFDKEVSSPFQEPHFTERCRDLGNCLRFAAAFLRMTKLELIGCIGELFSSEEGLAAVDDFTQASKKAVDDCRIFADLLDTANVRVLIASASCESAPPKEAQP